MVRDRGCEEFPIVLWQSRDVVPCGCDGLAARPHPLYSSSKLSYCVRESRNMACERLRNGLKGISTTAVVICPVLQVNQ